MSQSENQQSYPKLASDTELATQHGQLEAIQKKFQKIEEDHMQQFNGLKAQAFVKKSSVFDELREVFKTIPNFWYTALVNTPFFSEIEESPEVAELLKFVSDVHVEYDPKFSSGGKIHLHFNDNPFLTNATLTRQLSAEEGSDSSATKVESTKINWKEGKETVFTKDETNPFLGWFLSTDPSETDYFFMQDFYPEAVEYFKGQGIDYDDFSGSLGSSDEELDDEEDFSEEDDEVDGEEEEEENEPASKKAKLDQ